MRRTLTALAFVLGSTLSAHAQDRDAAGEESILAAINARRASEGAGVLVRDARLDEAAYRHSVEMARHQRLEHVSEESGTPADRVQAAGLSLGEIAENVAMHHTSDAAQASLEGSEAHLTNMINSRFTHVGIAAVPDSRGVYVTQVFGRIESPITSPSLPPPVGSAEASASAVTTVTVPSGDGTVYGYWICSSSRWWYYPLPSGAAGGQQLSADPSVAGPPPGHPAGTCTDSPTPVIATSPPVPTYVPQAPQAVVIPGGTTYRARVYAAPPAYPPPSPVYVGPRVYSAPVYAAPAYPPTYYYPPPPPPRGPRFMIVQPRPGAVLAPYGPGVSFELGIGRRPHGRVRVY